MLNFSNIQLKDVYIHQVGNKSKEEGIQFSHKPQKLSEYDKLLMLKYFLSAFGKPKFYHFVHDTHLELNEVYAYAHRIFADEEIVLEQSVALSKHLYEKSVHPKVKGGEFYTTYLTNCILGEEVVDVIGLFKTENKDTFLQVKRVNDEFEVGSENGININKSDKGCLILNTGKETGYIVALSDNHDKNETLYWINDFLKIAPCKNNHFYTKQGLNMLHGFIDELDKENEIGAIGKAELKHRAKEYFTENDHFNTESFLGTLGTDVSESFKEYKQMYEMDNKVSIPDEFEIDENAFKSAQKRFNKSVIKLDKNFHIYVHGGAKNIEKGYDTEKRMNFYKCYFKEEE